MTVYTSMHHFKADQPQRLAGFWAELLGIPVDDGASDELAMIDAAHEHGPITWIFERASAETPPARRFTLDLTDDKDWRGEVQRAEQIGAELVGEHQAGSVRWAELTDPEGNLFRIFAPRAASS
jgi:predicted enzyme related to lactoylglutathione lyase